MIEISVLLFIILVPLLGILVILAVIQSVITTGVKNGIKQANTEMQAPISVEVLPQPPVKIWQYRSKRYGEYKNQIQTH